MRICDFKQWIQKRRYLESGLGGVEDPTDRFRFNNNQGNDIAVDYERIQQELVKLVMAKYQPKVLQFLKVLAEEHADQELMTLIRKLETDNSPGAMMGSNSGWKPRNAPDDIVAPEADKGNDANDSGS